MARKPPKGPSLPALKFGASTLIRPWERPAPAPKPPPVPIVVKPQYRDAYRAHAAAVKAARATPAQKRKAAARQRADLMTVATGRPGVRADQARARVLATLPLAQQRAIMNPRPFLPPPGRSFLSHYLTHPLAQAYGYSTAAALTGAQAAWQTLEDVVVPHAPQTSVYQPPNPYRPSPLGKIPERGAIATRYYENLPETVPALSKAAGREALAGGEALGKTAARLGLGLAAPVAQALAQDSSPQAQAFAQQIQQESIAPTDVGQVAANVGAFGAGGAYGGVTHPLRALNDGINVLRGVTQAAVGLPVALLNPEVSNAQRRALIKDFAHQFIAQLAGQIGPDVTLSQAFAEGQKVPVEAVLTALAVAEPGLKAVEVLRYMQAGATLRVALRLARDPALSQEILGADAARTLRYRGNEMPDFTVEVARSRSATGRAIQGAYDPLSAGLERIPGVRSVIGVRHFGQSRRALRALRSQEKRATQRLKAEGLALSNEVDRFLRAEDPNDELGLRARLFYSLQRPADVPEETWLNALKNDLEAMLAGREVIHPGEAKTPAELKLERRVNRWGRRVEGMQRRLVHEEHQRLQYAALTSTRDIRAARAHRAEIEADTNLSEAEKASQLQVVDHAIASAQSRASSIAADLKSIGVDETPVSSPVRADLVETVGQLPNVSAEGEQALMQLLDHRARVWGRANSRDPGEYYGDPTGLGIDEIRMIEHNADLPAGALAQFREGTPISELAARYTPRKVRGAKKIAGLPKQIKGAADLGRLVDEMARRLQEGLPYAQHWYRDSGQEILDATGGNVDRADLLAQLVAIYSPQKPVAPNIALAMRVLDDAEHGRGVRFGNRHQRALAKAALGGEDWLAKVRPDQLPKVRRFYANLLKYIDPERLAAHGFTGREVTVDGWMGAAFGYGFNTGNSGLTAAQFRFVEDVVQRLADHYGVSPEEAQAAIWTSIKAERDRSTATLYADPATRGEALARSGQSFADALFTPRNTLRLPLDSISPGKTWLADLTPEAQAAHRADYGNAVLNALHEEGFIARREGGGYAVEIAMGDRPVTRMAGKEVVNQTDRALYLSIPQGMRDTAEGLASAIGDAFQTPTSSWARYLNARGQARDVTAYRLDIGRPLTPGEADQLVAALPKDLAFEPTDSGGIIAHVKPGPILDRSIKVERDLRAGLTEAKTARKQLQDEAKARTAQVDTAIEAALASENTATVTQLAHRGGQLNHGDYQARLARGRRSDLHRRIRDRLAAEAQVIDSRYGGSAAAGPGRPVVHFAERADPEHLTRFVDALEANPRAAFLGHPTPGELANHRVFLSEDGAAGYALSPSLDLQNVFRNPPMKMADGNFSRGGVPGAGRAAVEHAIGNGARTLDAFDGYLPDMYGELGFNETGRMRWNDEYAPANWDYALHGRPDVIFMAHQVEAQPTRYFESWDTAKAHSQELAAKTPRPPLLAQTRESDLLGAVQYLNTEDGARVLYLAQNADVSTLLHELIGHSTREIADAYPEQWAAVEAQVGRPLAEWSVDDYEWLARSLERYAAEGLPPTPELLPVLQHLKREMRTIYGGLRSISPEPLPPAVTRLFDSYFGAYEDANVHRVAAWSNGDIELERARGVLEQASKELATLRRSRDTRAYNRSIAGLEQRVGELAGKPVLSAAEEEELARLSANLNIQVAQQAQHEVDRETGLRQRISEIEKALANPTSRRYEGALGSLQALTDLRQGIMDNLFGDHVSAFENRTDLMADWLVDQGFMRPDFEHGSARYVSHRSASLQTKAPRAIERPNRPLVEGQSVGPPSSANLNLHHRNNLYRWQNGDLNADPAVVFADWQNAMSFAYIHGLKERLWDLGRPLNINETVPEDVYILNRSGSPVPELNRRERPPAETDSVQAALNSLDGHDPVASEELLTEYAKNILMKPEDAREMMKTADPAYLDLKVIDRQVLDSLFRPLKGASSELGQSLDLANSIARMALIYSNPAYIPINFVANTFFLLGQQGPEALSSLVRSARMLLKNKRLADRVRGEIGELGGLAIREMGRQPRNVGIGQHAVQGFEKGEKWLAVKQATGADVMPRIAAWVYEARRLGYRSEDDLFRLLRGGTPKTVRDREIIAERSNEIMVNFQRMGDWERQNVARVLFVWPWLRGATAWPFYYAKEFPVRTGALAVAAEPAEARRRRLLGENVRPGYRGLFPVEGQGRTAEVINVQSISPTDTAAGLIESARGEFLSLIQDHEVDTGNRLLDYLNPMYEMIYHLVGATGSFGNQKPLRDLLAEDVMNFVPQGSLTQQLTDPSKASKAFRRRDAISLLTRRIARVRPEEVDVVKLQVHQQSVGRKTIVEQTDESMATLQKQASAVGDREPIPNTVRQAIVRQHTYEEAVQLQKDKIKASSDWQPSKAGQTEPKLTDQQTAWIAYQMYIRYLPGAAHQLLRPDQLYNADAELYATYARALLYGNKTEGIDGLFQSLVDFRAEIQKAKRAG